MSAQSTLTDNEWEAVSEWVHDGLTQTEISRKIASQFNKKLTQSGLSRAEPYRQAQRAAQKAKAEEAKQILEKDMATNAEMLTKMMRSLITQRDKLEAQLVPLDADSRVYSNICGTIAEIDKSYSKFLNDYNSLYDKACILSGGSVTASNDGDDTVNALLHDLAKFGLKSN
jgi:hypothetical protein